jgi:glycosyltransferase involved in cell wall biosynthesis
VRLLRDRESTVGEQLRLLEAERDKSGQALDQQNLLRKQISSLEAELGKLGQALNQQEALQQQVRRLEAERDKLTQALKEQKTLREQVRLLGAERDKLSQSLNQQETLNDHIRTLEAERNTLRRQRDALESTRGNVTLAARFLLKRKLQPWFGRARAYVEARPALKARLLRTLPKPTLYRLQRYARGAVKEAPSRAIKQPVKTLTVPEGQDLIVLCGSYPDGGGHYGGEFIRARVLAYRARGVKCLVVVCNHRYSKINYKIHEGIEILQVPALQNRSILEFLRRRDASSIFVHSPSPDQIHDLIGISENKCVVLWFHGYEVRDYRRLLYNFSTEELERQREFLDTINRSRFMALKSLDAAPKIKTVFVSDFLLNVARSDSGARLENSAIIHNFIDGDFFSYKQKTPEMARRILLIRSFQTRNYANDIAIGALRLLSGQPGFERLRITIRGTGRYFKELTAPLAEFSNIDVKEVYLSAQEVKKLHDDHGLFLVPSRFDTQGVSMCEAMASGLVCVTNPVAAIPEFFDESCGYLALADSVQDFADAITSAISAGEVFVSKSEAAARRVRKQCGLSETIARELSVVAPEMLRK